jgi:hypothetical protein
LPFDSAQGLERAETAAAALRKMRLANPTLPRPPFSIRFSSPNQDGNCRQDLDRRGADGPALVYRTPETDRLLRVTDALDGEDVLPGFRLPLAELFAELSFE